MTRAVPSVVVWRFTANRHRPSSTQRLSDEHAPDPSLDPDNGGILIGGYDRFLQSASEADKCIGHQVGTGL
jgi:hypothetical protein